MTRPPTIAQLHNLADRAEAGLTPDEVTRLRQGIAMLAEYDNTSARLRKLHQPMQRGPFTICAHCSGWDGERRCLGVVTNYPCPTITALDQPGPATAQATEPGSWLHAGTRDLSIPDTTKEN